MEIKYLQSRDLRAIQTFLKNPRGRNHLLDGLDPAKCLRHRSSFTELIENMYVCLSALLDFSLENTMLSFELHF